MKKRIPSRNQSPYGWWVAIILERFEFKDEIRKNQRRRQLAYENLILIKAKTREQAYKKAMRYGKLGQSESTNINGRKYCWKFEGLLTLLPVYEKLEDGAEIMWTKHNRSLKTLRSWVKKKNELETFIDKEK